MLLFTSFFDKKSSDDALILTTVKGMLDSIKALKTLDFDLSALERVDGKFLTADSKIKLMIKPKTILFRNEKKKISVFWKEGLNENKALVKAKLVFTATLSLDPYGSMMRKNQHYTIHELGFEYFATTFSVALLKDKDNVVKNLKFLGRKKMHGKDCIGIHYEDPKFHYFDHKVGKNESVSTLAIKFNVNDYLIRSKNDLKSFYSNIKEGKVLKIPSNYCKKIILFVDETTGLPVSITSYDEVGLYENYEYTRLLHNVKLKAEDFKGFFND